jgi:kinetochore protein Mis13/DSN1
MGNKPSHGNQDSGAELAGEQCRAPCRVKLIVPARMIKESLLKDFANKSEFSDWFNREESAPSTKVIKKPNPRNLELEENLVGLEARLTLYVIPYVYAQFTLTERLTDYEKNGINGKP